MPAGDRRPEPGLLSPEQVARRCGLSRRAVYRAIERGELPASRLCNRLRIDAADIDAWVTENRVAVTRLPQPSHASRQTLPVAGGLRRLLDEP